MAGRISVIVPIYNTAAELPRCLDSILSQTYLDLEIVAVNDGSQDDSGVILDQYAASHSNIHVIHKENGGVTSARLRGVQEATGDWIGFVDGDDEIEPEMYEHLMNNAVKYDAQISHCGYQMVFPDGRVNYFHNTGVLLEHDKNTALRELLSGEIIEPGLCNKLFHKQLFHGLLHENIMDASIKINEDLLMNYYLFSAASKSVFDDWCPYHYIVRNTSASRAKMNWHKIYDPVRVKDIIRQTADLELHDDAQRAYINTCINIYHTLIAENDAYQDDLQKVRKMLKEEKNSFTLLGKKRGLMAKLIVSVPTVYKVIYGVYYRYLQKRVYS